MYKCFIKKEAVAGLGAMVVLNDQNLKEAEKKEFIGLIKENVIKDELIRRIFEETQGRVFVYNSGPGNEVGLHAILDIISKLSFNFSQAGYFGLILGNTGMALSSSLGIISFMGFIQGTSFTLAEFLSHTRSNS
ncbi:MAG: hypothetical protein NC898_06300 [Candidatus Omnitrophica bacterium]|nr:hypothetical protein [Candidatus Omnitrophota bacterium]